MFDKLKNAEIKFEEINQKLMDPDIISDNEQYKNLRAYSTTGPKPVIPAYRCAKYGYCVRTMQLTDVCG